MTYTCPVCKFDGLRRAPANYSSCPCCRTEFGTSDFSWSHDQLRQEWIDNGALWASTYVQQPPNWSAIKQLERAGIICTDEDLIKIARGRRERDTIPT